MTNIPRIIDYIDYTLYVKDWYEYQKSLKPSFSYRVFSTRVKFKSKSYLSSVVSGKRQLSRKSISKMVEGMNLTGDDAEYFSHLVCFKTSKTNAEKNIFWKKIKTFQIPNLNKKKIFKKYELIENWYTLPLREIICVTDFDNNFKKLGKMILPPISQKEAHDAVELLLDLGLVEKKDNRYIQSDFEILFDPDVKRFAAQNFQKQIITIGAEALSQLRSDSVHTQTVTFGSNPSLNGEIDRIIHTCIEEIYEAIQKYPTVQEVKQLNLQFFSLSKNNLI